MTANIPNTLSWVICNQCYGFESRCLMVLTYLNSVIIYSPEYTFYSLLLSPMVLALKIIRRSSKVYPHIFRGCADGGRLGHGSLTATKKTPEIVTSLLSHKIAQVSCGQSHTVSCCCSLLAVNEYLN